MKNQTNVLMIQADHWFAGLLGAAGHPVVLTPTLNELAEKGTLFSNCYSECPVCVPARRSLMTGLTPRSHGDRVYDETLPMPGVKTLAQSFRDAGYQAYAVGKLHVQPQRSRIGFDDVILQEEGRYQYGVIDDYQIWLGDQNAVGQEFMHGMGNNEYTTRPWHLPEYMHPTNWATSQMVRFIKRKDPTRPALFYISYMFPHPPLVPLAVYQDMYDLNEIDEPFTGDWAAEDIPVLRQGHAAAAKYSHREIQMARRAFYAQCTHIDHQIRILIGTLREEKLLDNTVILFTSDHGDMLFNHGLVAKRVMYENSANIPLIITGRPAAAYRGNENRLVCLADIMPTLLDICGLEIPGTVEGRSAFSQNKREMLYCEIGEGMQAIRMVHDGRFKLVYSPAGNYIQLFDLEKDPHEMVNAAGNPEYARVREKLISFLIKNFYGGDEAWADGSRLIGLPCEDDQPQTDYGLYNQRGGHWPPPTGRR